MTRTEELERLLRACVEAMKVAQTSPVPTDWSHMIADIDRILKSAETKP